MTVATTRVAGKPMSNNVLIFGVVVLAVALLLRRRASSPTVMTVSGVGFGNSTGAPSGPGVYQGPPSLNGSGTPSGVPMAGASDVYVVRPGDTLTGIAQRELGNVNLANTIAAMNGGLGTANALSAGTELQLPPTQYGPLGQVLVS